MECLVFLFGKVDKVLVKTCTSVDKKVVEDVWVLDTETLELEFNRYSVRSDILVQNTLT